MSPVVAKSLEVSALSTGGGGRGPTSSQVSAPSSERKRVPLTPLRNQVPSSAWNTWVAATAGGRVASRQLTPASSEIQMSWPAFTSAAARSQLPGGHVPTAAWVLSERPPSEASSSQLSPSSHEAATDQGKVVINSSAGSPPRQVSASAETPRSLEKSAKASTVCQVSPLSSVQAAVPGAPTSSRYSTAQVRPSAGIKRLTRSRERPSGISQLQSGADARKGR